MDYFAGGGGAKAVLAPSKILGGGAAPHPYRYMYIIGTFVI